MVILVDDIPREEYWPGYLQEEEQALQEHPALYRSCLDHKLLRDRKTEQEIRDGIILLLLVYRKCKPA